MARLPEFASVVVIGAGPAGLATSRELTLRGLDHVVLERGDRVAHVWTNLYDGLVLHTGKHLSSLPGMPFSRDTPLFPTRRHFVEYLVRYAEEFRLPVRTGAEVSHVERIRQGWILRTAGGAHIHTRVIVCATGIVSNPVLPPIDGSGAFGGTIVHSVAYRRPGPFVGRRVLVVGAGNSAGDISVELAGAGAHVTIAVRSGARAVPRDLFGVPIQYFAAALASLPPPIDRLLTELAAAVAAGRRGPAVLPPPVRSCSNVPLIGHHLVDAIRAGTIRVERGVTAFAADSVQFTSGRKAPFDDVIMATGYRAAVRSLEHLIRTDPCGFAVRRGRVASADQRGLYFVGHNYDARGGLRNIAHDARLASKLIARWLASGEWDPGATAQI